MRLTDNTYYLLPDDTRVRAVKVFRAPAPDGWRLDSTEPAGPPLYLWTPNDGWLRLVFNADTTLFDVAVCDLQFDDLREADRPRGR